MADTARHTLTHPSGKFEITVEGASRRDTFVTRGYTVTPLPETETHTSPLHDIDKWAAATGLASQVKPKPKPATAKPWTPSTAKASKPK